jgi:hypothetical protein
MPLAPARGQEPVALPVVPREVFTSNRVPFSPGGRRIAVSGEFTIGLWDVATGARQVTMSGHQRLVTSVAIRADALRLASGSSAAAERRGDDVPQRRGSHAAGHHVARRDHDRPPVQRPTATRVLAEIEEGDL